LITTTAKPELFIAAGNNIKTAKLKVSQSRITASGNEKLQQVKIYNTLGQLCSVSTSNNTIDIEHLPQGIYYLKVQTKSRELTSRFVKE